MPTLLAMTDPTVPQILTLLAIGLVAGTIGGMIGVGGSVIMIPALAIVFGKYGWASQHLFQASAMVVNLAVALPSALRHRAKGALRMDLFKVMLPAAIIAIIGGVMVSNLFSGAALKQAFALFLVYVIIDEIIKLARKRDDHDPEHARVDAPRGVFVGGVMGFAAGLLGIGGGGIAVPMARVVCRLPMRECIGTVSAIMCVTAAFGATTKVATLGQHNARWQDALVIALLLSPTAVLGGHFGAGLTHRLPIRVVRLVFVITLIAATGRMGGLY